MFNTFLAVDQFKIPRIIFYYIFFTLLYFTMNPYYICSNDTYNVTYSNTHEPANLNQIIYYIEHLNYKQKASLFEILNKQEMSSHGKQRQ